MGVIVVVLGSTGSIGKTSLNLAAKFGLCVEALSCNKNIALLNEQIAKFKPKFVCVGDERLRGEVRGMSAGAVFAGEQGLLDMLEICKSSVVINALVGFAGLRPSLKIQNLGKKLALANKESLVAGGKFLNARAINPIDSEHFGLKFLLDSPVAVRELIITASGGAFYRTPIKNLARVTPADALKHPNWDMGAKITIDSATMANKLFEILEAYWLYAAGQNEAKFDGENAGICGNGAGGKASLSGMQIQKNGEFNTYVERGGGFVLDGCGAASGDQTCGENASDFACAANGGRENFIDVASGAHNSRKNSASGARVFGGNGGAASGVKISALIEPTSMVHALVAFEDGSTTAHLSRADMSMAIAHAILSKASNEPDFGCSAQTYGQNLGAKGLNLGRNFNARISENLDLLSLKNIKFHEINLKKYPIFSLKDEVLANPDLGVAINAANEAGVYKFLKGECGFLDISRTVLAAVRVFGGAKIRCIDDVFSLDKEVREWASKNIGKI